MERQITQREAVVNGPNAPVEEHRQSAVAQTEFLHQPRNLLAGASVTVFFQSSSLAIRESAEQGNKAAIPAGDQKTPRGIHSTCFRWWPNPNPSIERINHA